MDNDKKAEGTKNIEASFELAEALDQFRNGGDTSSLVVELDSYLERMIDVRLRKLGLTPQLSGDTDQ